MEAPVHVAWTSLRKGPKPTGKWSAHNGSMTFHLRRGESRDVRPRLPHRDVSWIGEHRRPFRDYSVGSLVPVVFETYARILHPAWGPSVTGKDRPVRWDAVAAWSGRTMHALAQWERLSVPVTEAVAPPFVAPPNRGGLPPASLAALCGVLAAHSTTPEGCFVGVWEGYGWPVAAWAGPHVVHLENRSFHVRRGRLALALEVGWQPVSGRFEVEPPTLIWPADQAWFVAADPDLDSTYLGGSAALVDAVIAHANLEAWQAAASDEIGVASDSVNL